MHILHSFNSPFKFSNIHFSFILFDTFKLNGIEILHRIADKYNVVHAIINIIRNSELMESLNRCNQCWRIKWMQHLRCKHYAKYVMRMHLTCVVEQVVNWLYIFVVKLKVWTDLDFSLIYIRNTCIRSNNESQCVH